MNLTKKQQIQVSLIVLFVVILLWQLYKLFSAPTTVLAPVPQQQARKEAGLGYPAAPGLPTVTATGPSSAKAAAIPALEGVGTEYTRLSSELQIIQMQRAIAESYEAIAVAKRNTAKAMAEMAQIVGSNISLPSAANMETPHLNNEYELIYTGQEGGQWTATLKKNNQTFDVVPNTVLGNMKVVNIDDNGVTVVQGDVRKTITFNGIVPAEVLPTAINGPNLSPAVAKIPSQVDAASLKPGSQSQVVTKPLPVQTTVAAKPAASESNSQVKPVSQDSLPAKPATAPIVQPGPALFDKATVSVQPIKSVDIKPAPLATASKVEVKLDVIAKDDHLHDKKDLQKLAVVTVEDKQTAANDNGKLSALNPIHYTIQLAADNNAAALAYFAKTHRLSDKAIIVKTTRNGRDWYVLVYGDYASVSSANAALDDFDEDILDWDPFVRSIGNLQKGIANVK